MWDKGGSFCDLMDCSPPASSVHGDSPGKDTGVGCHALLQRIFPTQGSNPGLPHCRILYHLSLRSLHINFMIVTECRKMLCEAGYVFGLERRSKGCLWKLTTAGLKQSIYLVSRNLGLRVRYHSVTFLSQQFLWCFNKCEHSIHWNNIFLLVCVCIMEMTKLVIF